jgi:hypothetical protein
MFVLLIMPGAPLATLNVLFPLMSCEFFDYLLSMISEGLMMTFWFPCIEKFGLPFDVKEPYWFSCCSS